VVQYALGEIALEIALVVGLWWYLTSTRDRDLDALTPRNEIQRYFTLLMWIGIYGFGDLLGR
jgi:methane/ammonia monooxygenase subunit C